MKNLKLAFIALLFFYGVISGQDTGPQITPEGGLFSNSRLVILGDSENNKNETIYYTLDGTNPLLSNSRKIYKNPFKINHSCTVKAVSLNTKGLKSTLSSAEFKKISRLNAPTIQKLTNSNSYAIFVDQEINQKGVELFFTTDGSDPSLFGHKYKGEIFSKNGTHIKAIALHEAREYLNSEIVSLKIDTTGDEYKEEDIVKQIIFQNTETDPSDTSSLEIMWRTGESAGDFLISFSHPASDVDFIYTLDGSDPLAGSTMWNGRAINIKSPAHIKVRTYEMGMKLGPIEEKVFNPPRLSAPVSNIASGTPFSGDLNIILSVPGQALNDIEILFTTNGQDPLKEGILYTGAIVLSENSVIRAIAQGAGFSSSIESRFEYFHMIEVTSALFLDKNRDGYVESARLTLSSPASNKPPKLSFIDPVSREEFIVHQNEILFSDNREEINISFNKPLKTDTDFIPGHFGSVVVAGEYSTTPFLVYGEGSELSLESERQLNPAVINNPFVPGTSTLSEVLQEISEFSVSKGTAVTVRPIRPSFGYGSIFDALGNIILSKREMVEQEDNGTLYLFWDGKNDFGETVGCGNYLAIITTEEKLSGVSAQGRAFISVKCQ